MVWRWLINTAGYEKYMYGYRTYENVSELIVFISFDERVVSTPPKHIGLQTGRQSIAALRMRVRRNVVI